MSELAEFARQFDYIAVFIIFVYAMVGACVYTITEGISLIVRTIHTRWRKRQEKRAAEEERRDTTE